VYVLEHFSSPKFSLLNTRRRAPSTGSSDFGQIVQLPTVGPSRSGRSMQTAKHCPHDPHPASSHSHGPGSRVKSAHSAPKAPSVVHHTVHGQPVGCGRTGTRPNQLLAPGASWAVPSAATEGPAADAVADAATETPSEPRASQRAAGSYMRVHRCALQAHARSAVAPRGD
jgi:hypothetical protein